MTPPSNEPDYRFSLANERTYLAWVRTIIALIAGGLVAAKALEWHHDVWRWVVAGPPLAAAAVLSVVAVNRWKAVDATIRAGGRLPVGRHLRALGFGLAVYAVLVAVVTVIDS